MTTLSCLPDINTPAEEINNTNIDPTHRTSHHLHARTIKLLVKQISNLLEQAKKQPEFALDSLKLQDIITVSATSHSLLSTYFFITLLQNALNANEYFSGFIPQTTTPSEHETPRIELSDQEQVDKITDIDNHDTNVAELMTLAELMDTLHYLEEDLAFRINNLDRHDKSEIIKVLLEKKDIIETRLRNLGILEIKAKPPFLETALGITTVTIVITGIMASGLLSSLDLESKYFNIPSFDQFKKNASFVSTMITKLSARATPLEENDDFFDCNSDIDSNNSEANSSDDEFDDSEDNDIDTDTDDEDIGDQNNNQVNNTEPNVDDTDTDEPPVKYWNPLTWRFPRVM